MTSKSRQVRHIKEVIQSTFPVSQFLQVEEKHVTAYAESYSSVKTVKSTKKSNNYVAVNLILVANTRLSLFLPGVPRITDLVP